MAKLMVFTALNRSLSACLDLELRYCYQKAKINFFIWLLNVTKMGSYFK